MKINVNIKKTAYLLIVATLMSLISGCLDIKAKTDITIGAVTPGAWKDNILSGTVEVTINNNISAKLKSYKAVYYTLDSIKIGEGTEKSASTSLNASATNTVSDIIFVDDSIFNVVKPYSVFNCDMTFTFEDKNGNKISLMKRVKITRDTTTDIYLKINGIKIRDDVQKDLTSGMEITNNLKPEIEMTLSDNIAKNAGEYVRLEDITSKDVALKNLTTKIIANKLIAIPLINLEQGHIYRVTITQGLESVDGMALKEDAVYEFSININYIKLVSVAPLNGSTKLSLLNEVTVIFNNKIDLSSVKQGVNLIITEDKTDISVNVTKVLNEDLKTLKLTWDFSFGKKYTVLFKSGETGIRDIYNNSFEKDEIILFETVQKTVSQYLELKNTQIKEKDLAVNMEQGYSISDNLKPQIILYFTDATILDQNTITKDTIGLFDITANANVEGYILSGIANKLSIKPETLVDGHSYRIRIVKGLKGINGEELKENEYKVEFNTRIVLPEIGATIPIAGSTGLELSHKLEVNFNKAIDSNSAATNTAVKITEKDLSSGAEISVKSITYSFTDDLKKMTLNWTFKYGKKYTIQLKDIKDLYGNPMAEKSIEFSTIKEAQTGSVPIPENLTAASGKDTITLSWNEPTDKKGFYILGYNVYIGEDNSNLYMLSNKKNPNVEFTNSILINSGDTTVNKELVITTGKTYYFKVTTVTEGNLESDKGNLAAAYVYNGNTPIIITNEIKVNMGLYHTVNGEVAGVKLEWLNKGKDIYYVIYRSITDTLVEGNYVKIAEINDSGTNSVSFIDTTISPQKYIWYKIACGTTLGGVGVSSGSVLAKDESPPATPTIDANSYPALAANQGDNRNLNIYLSWKGNTERDLGGYKIYITKQWDGEYKLAMKTPFTGGVAINPALVDSSWTFPDSYFLKISAYDQVGNESLPTQYISVNNISPNAPDTVTAMYVRNPIPASTLFTHKIILSWAEVTSGDIKGYTVYRLENGSLIKLLDIEGAKNTNYEDPETNINTAVATTYAYRIKTRDVYGNESLLSAASNSVTTIP